MTFKEGHALIIGVRSHRHSAANDVPITYSDAEAVQRILIDPTRCGYPEKQVKFLHDDTATAQGIKDALDALANDVKKTDTVALFFAGHGAFGTDDNYYLVTHDVRFVDVGGLELKVEAGTALSQIELLAKIKQIQAERVVLIFNACHSGSLQPKALGAGVALSARPAAQGKSLPLVTASALLSTGEGRIVISACKPDQLSSYYPTADLTFFAQALTDGLKGKAPHSSGYISAFNLYTYVYEAVAQAAKKASIQQDPMITVLQGVGPFPVALAAKSAKALGALAIEELPDTDAVHHITREESQDWLFRIEHQTLVQGDYVEGDKFLGNKIGRQINTGGGAYVGGNVNTGGGGFVGRDRIVTTGPVATGGSAVNTGSGVAFVGDGNTVITGKVGGNVIVGNSRPSAGSTDKVDFLRLLADIRRDVAGLGLEALRPEDRADALAALDKVSEQANRNPPPGDRIVKGLASVQEILDEAAESGLAEKVERAWQLAQRLFR